MTSNPLVSVIIPTFNRAHIVGAAIESVLDGPAGLAIGAREPAGIALAIAAGIHARLAERGQV